MSEKPNKSDGAKRKHWRTSSPIRKTKPGARTTKTVAGLAARQTALELIGNVLHRGHSLDDSLASIYQSETNGDREPVDVRDRGFARLLATTVLRRHGQLSTIIADHLEKPLPANGRHAQLILLSGTAQLLFLDVAPHAVINTAVELSRRQRSSARFAGLINAVLRRIAEQPPSALPALEADDLNIPAWMLKCWIAAYGETTARAIASASLNEPPLDISVRDKAEDWTSKLDGLALPTGTVRRRTDGRIEELPGFAAGHWWVQDAAAALPARLFGDITGQRIADLCAAPGGKTAQLANAGAQVTALDISQARLARVRENLIRLGLKAELVTGDATAWQADCQFDGILVDAPCSATGTIRRHPDILHLKRPDDIDKLSQLQGSILSHAATSLLRPGGIIIYCTCSLEPEEGETQIALFLSRHAGFERIPVNADEVGGIDEFITPDGDVRTLPNQLPDDEPCLSGLDGFFISRLRRIA